MKNKNQMALNSLLSLALIAPLANAQCPSTDAKPIPSVEKRITLISKANASCENLILFKSNKEPKVHLTAQNTSDNAMGVLLLLLGSRSYQ